jgi:hypothetical protein
MTRELRAAVLLFVSTSQRMFREGLILRSLVFPTMLTAGTLVVTLLVATTLFPPKDVALSPDETRTELVAWLEAHQWPTHRETDLRGAITSGTASAAIEGNKIYARNANDAETMAEAALRDVIGSSWRIDPKVGRPGGEAGRQQGLLIVRILASVFAMYGGVFGAGAIARDQDDGTLDAERTLPIRPWIHGGIRWAAATVILSVYAIPGIALFDALVGVPELGATCRNAVAACAATTALGIATNGRSGMKTGFSNALLLSLALSTGLGVLRLVVPGVAPYLPVASLYIESDGWIALLVALGFGALAVARSARTLGTG